MLFEAIAELMFVYVVLELELGSDRVSQLRLKWLVAGARCVAICK